MKGWHVAGGGAVALAGLLAVFAQRQLHESLPRAGQPGKDAPWVPTPEALVHRMLDKAKVTAGDYVVDLGSGDGRIVIAAAKRGGRALGIEFNPSLVELSRTNARKEGVSGKASFVEADLFQSDFSDATVVTMFLPPDAMLKLRPKLLGLKPGTRIMSTNYKMEDWEADDTVTIEDGCSTSCTAFLWTVPATVAGIWRASQGEFIFKQRFQILTGTYAVGEYSVPIVGGRLRGDEITFSEGGAQYEGRVKDAVMEGSATVGGRQRPWKATLAR